MNQVTLSVPDVSCNHCAMTIKRELAGVQGISGVEVDVAKKTVTFQYANDQALEQAKAVLADIGYPIAAQS
jgi:copper chaperone